jgi:hypothetical protein
MEEKASFLFMKYFEIILKSFLANHLQMIAQLKPPVFETMLLGIFIPKVLETNLTFRYQKV